MFGGTVAPTCLWASGKPPAANLPILPATPLSCSATIGSTKALSLSCSPLQAGCSSPPREAPYSLPPSRTCACSPCRPSNGLTSQGQSLRGRWPIKCGSTLTLTGSPGAERHHRERLHHRHRENVVCIVSGFRIVSSCQMQCVWGKYTLPVLIMLKYYSCTVQSQCARVYGSRLPALCRYTILCIIM